MNKQGTHKNSRWPLESRLQNVLCRYFRILFRSDSVRLSSPLGERIFLIIGNKRNTKQDRGGGGVDQDGKRVDWDYLAESCIASGGTSRELVDNAKCYKKVSGLSVLEALERGYTQANRQSNPSESSVDESADFRHQRFSSRQDQVPFPDCGG